MSHTEAEIIKILLVDPNSTAEIIANKLELTKRTIERAFTSLQNKGIIERIGSKKWKDGKFLNKSSTIFLKATRKK